MPSAPQVRSHGTAPSTNQNRKSAILKLNTYIQKRTGSQNTFSDLSDTEAEALFCTEIEEYENIATFLASQCVLPKRGQKEGSKKAELALGTATTYFGYIVIAIKDRFPSHICWNNRVFDERIVRLRRNMKVNVIRHCIANDIPLWTSTPSIGREGIIAVIDSCLRVGGSLEQQKEGVYRAAE